MCRGAGSALLNKPHRIEQIARAMGGLLRCPLTLKIRKGYSDDKDLAHALVPRLHATGHVAAVTIHGRSRQQRCSTFLLPSPPRVRRMSHSHFPVILD